MTSVAVIGAGAAGLVTAAELHSGGHEVVVMERTGEIGGVWVFDETPGRTMYDSLRTNLPRDLMAFRSHPFDSRGGGADDWPRFPGHREVLTYLRHFATTRGVDQMIEFDTTVTRVEHRGPGWAVETSGVAGPRHRCFDAVAVCNGHFTIPRVPSIAGSTTFPGEVVHSRDYRRPDGFAGRRVAVIGTGSSGFDLSLEISEVADQVIWCGAHFDRVAPHPQITELRTAPLPHELTTDGKLATGGSLVPVDIVLLCTGYHYDLDFLEPEVASGTDVPAPLYRHLLPIGYPTMALIGIPQRIIPFPLFEAQARWFSAVLAGAVELPPTEDQVAWLDDWRRHCRATGRSDHEYRNIGVEQFDYIDELAAECGAPLLPDWYRPLARATERNRLAHPLDYRDQPMGVRGDSRLSPRLEPPPATGPQR